MGLGRHRPRHALHRRPRGRRAVGGVEILADTAQLMLRVAERDGLRQRRGGALGEARRQVEGDHGGSVAHAGQAPGGALDLKRSAQRVVADAPTLVPRVALA
ncbi:MAG: hypothetical protein ACK559_42270, partial [bacterium]